jgi:hypothetical protein
VSISELLETCFVPGRTPRKSKIYVLYDQDVTPDVDSKTRCKEIGIGLRQMRKVGGEDALETVSIGKRRKRYDTSGHLAAL